MVRIIQMKLHDPVDIQSFDIWIGAYKLFLPILNFWTVYLEIPTDYSEKLFKVEYPFDEELVYSFLEEAKKKIDRINSKSIISNSTSLTVVKNIFLFENLLTIVLFFFVIIILIYIYSITKT